MTGIVGVSNSRDGVIDRSQALGPTDSPTFAAPALGTPASGVVTNLSGVLPVGVTGGSGLTLGGTVGMISAFGVATAPTGWIICNGAAIARSGTYATLFAVISTAWGVGDGSSTFNLPDLRGAFLRGTGAHGSEHTAQGSSNKFTGPAVAAFSDDQFQNHEHDLHSFTGVNTSRPMSNNGSGNSSVAKVNTDGDATGSGAYWYGTRNMVGSSASSSAHTPPAGVPRTGYETKPFNAGVNYCIKF